MNVMFDDIFNLELERTPKQAFGFYLIFLILGLIVGGVVGILSGSVEDAMNAGMVAGVFYCTLIGYLVLSSKNRIEPGGIALLIVNSVIAYFVGAVFALIPIAYCTTLEKK